MSKLAERPPRATNGFPTVGLLLADLHTGASCSLWSAVADEARRRGMNLVCFAAAGSPTPNGPPRTACTTSPARRASTAS